MNKKKEKINKDLPKKKVKEIMDKKHITNNTNIELCIKNINYNATENELKSFFSKYGKVIFCKILRDDNQGNKGIGFVKFSDYNLMKIMSIISGRFKEDIYFKGRKLKIELAGNNGMNKKPLILYYVLIESSSCIFESINNKDIIYFIYYVNNCIKVMNIVDDEIILEIENAHNEEIYNLLHYTDKINKKDLLVSFDVSNAIKLWDVNTFECLCDFKNHKYDNRMEMFIGTYIFFSFMNDNNNYYFMFEHLSSNPTIEVSDLKGNHINRINYEENNIIWSLYYDNKLNNNYIVSGHFGCLQSINYTENKHYHIYYGDSKKEKFIVVNVKENNGISKLIAFSDKGLMKIWNFHTGSLINNIKLYDNSLVLKNYLKDDNNLFLLQDNVLKSINVNDGKIEYILKNIVPKNMDLGIMEKINHPKLGECFICQIKRK